jgi:hypothetical protein
MSSVSFGPEFGYNEDLLFYYDAANIKCYDGTNTMYNLGVSYSCDMTLYGSPLYSSDNMGVINLNGDTNEGRIPNLNYPFDTNDPFTLQLWIYIPTGASWSNGYYGNMLSKGDYFGCVGLFRSTISDNKVYAFARTDYVLKSCSSEMVRDKWTHISMTMDIAYGGTLSLYIDGDVKSSVATGFTYSLYENSNYLLASKNAVSGAYGNTMSGTFSSITLWKKSLSATEIKKTYEMTKTRFGHI